MSRRIGVVVMQSNRVVRDGLAALLDAQTDIRVVAAAGEPEAGLRRARETKPQVVLVDASLGNCRSHRFVEQVRQATPEARVVVMDLLPEAEEDLVEFVRAGATGFVSKRASADDLVAAIRSVAGGADVVPPSFTGLLCSYVAKHVTARTAQSATDAVRMTQREQAVIGLVAQGLSNKEIAQRLHIATYTVKSHVHNILEKLDLHNRVQIAARAYLGQMSASTN
jgi:DNA-binding NarL/FixJ family response regulator